MSKRGRWVGGGGVELGLVVIVCSDVGLRKTLLISKILAAPMSLVGTTTYGGSVLSASAPTPLMRGTVCGRTGGT